MLSRIHERALMNGVVNEYRPDYAQAGRRQAAISIVCYVCDVTYKERNLSVNLGVVMD